MSYYASPLRERMAIYVAWLRKQGYTREECVIALDERFNRLNEHVLVDSIFDRSESKTAAYRVNK